MIADVPWGALILSSTQLADLLKYLYYYTFIQKKKTGSTEYCLINCEEKTSISCYYVVAALSSPRSLCQKFREIIIIIQ
jgi:hypothetical protein